MKDIIALKKYVKSDLNRHMDLYYMNGVYKKTDSQARKKEEKWLEKSINNYKTKRPEFYVLKITLNDVYIGNVIAQKINFNDKNLDVGYWIGKEYWGRGYATKALKLFLKEVYKKFKSVRVTAGVKTTNIGSIKVLEKCGFKHEGTSRKVYKSNNKYVDEMRYAIVK